MIETVTTPNRIDNAINLTDREARLIERLRQLQRDKPTGTILVVEINCSPRQLRWREAGRVEG
jgi:hypothetical protein